jgi:hypothetical protein
MMKTNIEMAKNKGKNLEEWNSRVFSNIYIKRWEIV